MKKTVILLFLFILFSLGASAYEETLILFDTSLSMSDKMAGRPKYKMAAEEAQKIVNSLPDSAHVGLRIIGITLGDNLLQYVQNPEEQCKATKLLVPVGTGTKTEIKNTLNSLFPLGTTPLLYSIDSAVKNDFSFSSELKHIILVTDGLDGCGGDICSYITELMRTRKDIRIDVLALGLPSYELTAIRCLADSSSGTILNASNQKEIQDAFNDFFFKAPQNSTDFQIGSPDLKQAADNTGFFNPQEGINSQYNNNPQYSRISQYNNNAKYNSSPQPGINAQYNNNFEYVNGLNFKNSMNGYGSAGFNSKFRTGDVLYKNFTIEFNE